MGIYIWFSLFLETTTRILVSETLVKEQVDSARAAVLPQSSSCGGDVEPDCRTLRLWWTTGLGLGVIISVSILSIIPNMTRIELYITRL